jgi:mannosyltransferase
LRFAWLGSQSFDVELYTAHLARSSFTGMLHGVAQTEGSPPLYYILAWAWGHLFGTSEVGLRSLSAVLGLACVPISFLTARELISARVGLVTATLVAVSPYLVDISQFARSYALAVTLAALGLLFFARALTRGTRGDVYLWGACSALGVCTHYYVGVIAVCEAAILIRARGWNRPVVLSTALVLLVGAALIPLAAEQLHNPLADTPGYGLGLRALQVPKNFLVAYQLPYELVLSILAGVLGALGLALVPWRFWPAASPHARRRALMLAGLAAGCLLIPLLLVPAGIDLFAPKSVFPAFFPIWILLACGIATGRTGLAVGAALVAVSLVASLAPNVSPGRYGRADWRGVAAAAGRPRTARILIATNAYPAQELQFYFPRLENLPPQARVTDVTVVAVAVENLHSVSGGPVPPRHFPAYLPPGFTVTKRRRTATFDIYELNARIPRHLSSGQLAALAFDRHDFSASLQR